MTEELLVTKLTMIASQIQHEDDLMGQRTTIRNRHRRPIPRRWDRERVPKALTQCPDLAQ